MSALRLLAVVFLSACATTQPAEAPARSTAGTGDRQLVQSAELRIEREDPEAGVRKATDLAKELGGYAQRSGTHFASLRIPAPRLEEALTALGGLGKVADQALRTEDVTTARADLALRIENVRRTRERYLELLQRATTVADTLAIERELERITLELEQLQAQLERVDAQVQLAAVEVAFERPVRPGPVGWVFYGVYSAVKWLFVWS